MSWVTFNVILSGGNIVPDGQVDFEWGFADNEPNSAITGTLRYRHEDHGEGRVILSVANVPASGNGDYIFEDELFGPQDGVRIPPVPGFTGGDYHTLGSIHFTPSATNPLASGTLSAIFSNKSVRDTDDTCSWDASVTTPIPEAVKKAAY